MKDKFKRYAELIGQQRDIEAELKDIKNYFGIFMASEGVDVLESEDGYGTVSLYTKRRYQYPDEIVVKENQLKEEKKEAEARGTATYKETTYLRFDLPKK